MAEPVLTPGEIAQLNADKARQQNSADTLNAAIPAKNAKIIELQTSDEAFKKLFDYYKDLIIKPYDDERMALDGIFTTNPISEADVVGPANLDDSVRTTPAPPAVDLVRVAEFDGGGTMVDLNNETQHLLDITTTLTSLQAGFTNSERISKVTILPANQAFFDSLITTLETDINDRITSIAFQDAALGVNDDIDGTLEVAAALALNSVAQTFLTNYLLTTDVSDVGITLMTNEQVARDVDVLARTAQIVANYTGQSKNYYNQRYDLANNRGHLVRGSLRQVVVAQESVTTNSTYAATAQNAVNSIDSILP